MTWRLFWLSTSLVYFFTRIINLPLLPVFNDEAIYIDWGQKMLATGNFFLSLADGKQPLLMWIFGLMANIFPDPLFGARLVSVIFGFLSLLAIYKISKQYFSHSVAVISVVLYITSPLFLFFDRQALMESALTALSLWSLYYLHQLLTTAKIKYTVYLGLLWGIGMSLKSSFSVFVITSLVILFLAVEKSLSDKVKWFFLISPIMLIIIIPLLLQPEFSQIITLNSRFAYTLDELLTFPLAAWQKNIQSIIDITFWQTLFILGILIPIAIIKLFAKTKILVLWYLLGLLIYLFSTKSASTRYLISFLPLGLIFVSYLLTRLPKKFSLPLLATSLVWFVYLDFQLLFQPLSYFRFLAKVTPFSQAETYTGTFTSGFGVKPAIDYVLNQTRGSHAIVGTRLDAGNPENSVFFYLSKHPQIKVTYLDSKLLSQPQDMDYIQSDIPIYFITRNNQLAGLDKYLIKQKEFFKPDRISSVVVYQIRTAK